jgi:hypothetical protein
MCVLEGRWFRWVGHAWRDPTLLFLIRVCGVSRWVRGGWVWTLRRGYDLFRGCGPIRLSLSTPLAPRLRLSPS